MKIIKGFFILIVVWAICMLVLFGPSVFVKIGNSSNEISNQQELNKYDGYVVKKKEQDWFGNWIVAKKGKEEIVFKCGDDLFASLSVSDSLGD